MATSDLISILKKENKMDATLENRVCTAVLKQLDDTSADVQAVAIKCIGELTGRVQETQLKDICTRLCKALLDGKDELKDIYSIGLKTAVSSVPDVMGPTVANELTPQLIRGIQTDKSESERVREECLEVMKDLINRFGVEMDNQHESVMGLILNQLSSKKISICKRSTACVGSLAVVLADSLLNRLMETLLQYIASPRDGQSVRILIQTVGMISRTVGYRLGTHLVRIIPLFLRYLWDPGEDEDEDQEDEKVELRENILHAFESFAMRCPQEVSPFRNDLLNTCMKFIEYDPNYNYDDSDDEEMDDYSDDEYSEGEYSDDDDDTSWKVRRAAVKVVRAFIMSRPELLGDFYDNCSSALIARFKEREDSVKLDIVNCYEDLLRATILVSKNKSDAESKLLTRSGMTSPGIRRLQSNEMRAANEMDEVIRETSKLLKNKKTSTKVRIALFTMLQQLAIATKSELAQYFPSLINDIVSALKDRNGTLKLQALVFLRLSAQEIPHEVVRKEMSALVDAVAPCVNEEWYKIIAEALRVVSVFAQSLKPLSRDGMEFLDEAGIENDGFVNTLFHAAFKRFAENDIDQEIKECSIIAMGDIIARVGDKCVDECTQNDVFSILVERLQNEVTRMAALKTVTKIANSPLDIEFDKVLDKIIMELSAFLRQTLRVLRQSSLVALDALINAKGKHISADLFDTMLSETSALIRPSDLHLSYLSLQLATNALRINGENSKYVQKYVLASAVELSASPLTQGLALRSLSTLLAELVVLEVPGMTFEELNALLIEPVIKNEDSPRQTLQSVAQCIAVLCMATSDARRGKTVEIFLKDIGGKSLQKVKCQLALYSLGEVGYQCDLSRHDHIYSSISNMLQSNVEEIRAAAAYALGSITVGNMEKFLPQVLNALRTNDDLKYQFLVTLREIVFRYCSDDVEGDFVSYLKEVLPLLLENSRSEEEIVRVIVAECLGKIGSFDESCSGAVVSEIVSLGKSSNVCSRWTSATSVRHMLTTQSSAVIGLVEKNLNPFLDLLSDEDLNVRRASLLTLNSIVHHHANIMSSRISEILPLLYREMAVNDALKRVVDLGPFKHKVDDGLPLRKAAFTCMGTILDILVAKVDLGAFFEPLKKGLGDVNDVQMLCHQILVKMSISVPSAIVGAFDSYLKSALEKTLNKKVKDGQVGTEVERRNDVIRSALRAIDALSQLNDMKQSRTFNGMMEVIKRKDHLNSMLRIIRSDRDGGNSYSKK